MITTINCFNVLMAARIIDNVMIFEFDVFILSLFFNSV